jgi:signal transduction histidine kinase
VKKWVNRTWAKAAAFALTLVFAALTALGALGIAVLVSQGVFLDGGDALSAALYDEQCHSAISQADTFLRGVLTDAGLLNESSDAAGQPDGGTYFEGYYLDDAVIPNLFAQHFPRESFPCRLAVIDTNSGEVVFDNFSVNSGETILRSLEETFVYGLTTDATLYLTISAHLLEPMAPSSYAALMAAWLLEHTGLAVFLTALFGLLALFCFCFSMASAGHWPGREGIHLTWLDKIPADLWAAVLVCAFSAGWDAFYMEWGRIWFCVAMIPFVLLFLCVFAAQCKAGTIIRGTVIARVLRLLWRVLRGLAVWLWHIGRGLPLVWKTALVGLVIAGGEFLLYVNDFYLVRYNIFLALKIVELLALLAVALNLRTLEKNGQRLAEGDLTTPVDTRRLFGAFRRYGQAMNRLQSGMENAVQEQMRAERMKTEVITNVSHDIKTPLTSIVNYVDLLKKEDIPSPIAREYIAVLDRQSKRLKKLTEDLVEASKASSGALPVDLQPTDVNVLFSQIVGEYQDRLADCHLTLVAQPPEGQPVVAADSKLLSRVMDNLVSNICKYAMPETRVYVSGTVADGQMTLSFKNVSRAELNISPDELTERFVRGDASRHTEGSGLGLSIAQSLVQLMGGTFRLSIDADLFRADVTLPLVQQS